MRHMSPRITAILFALLVGCLTLGLVACGDDGGSADTTEEDAGATSDETESDVSAEPNELTVVSTEYEFDIPETLPAGPTSIVLSNEGKEKHFLEIVELKADAPSVEKLIKLQKADKFFVREALSIKPTAPGEESAPGEVDLTAGRYGYVCFIATPQGKPHAFLGMFGEFTVE